LFQKEYHEEEVHPLLKKLNNIAIISVGGYEGIPVKCGNTPCVFEFVTYKFCRGTSSTQISANQAQTHPSSHHRDRVLQSDNTEIIEIENSQ